MASLAVTPGTGGSTPEIVATNHWTRHNFEKVSPMVPWSVPSFLLGLHVIQSVVASIHGPPSVTSVSHNMDPLPEFLQSKVDVRRYVPRKRQLKPQRLLRRLGKDFDHFWMSKDLPSDVLEVTTKRNTDFSLLPESQSLELSGLIHNLYASSVSSNGTKLTENSSERITSPVLKQMTRTLQSWLVDFSSCLVYYKWEDLGLLYWPRWVRKGMCSPPRDDLKSYSSSTSSKSSSSSRKSLKSCSWPPGMHCVPNRAKKLKILRWVCKPSKTSAIFHRFRESGRRKAASRRHKGKNMEENEESVDDDGIIDHKISKDRKSKTLKIPLDDRKKMIISHTTKETSESSQGNKTLHKNIRLSQSAIKRMTKWPNIRPRAKRSRDEDVINKTENWNKARWNARRKKAHIKCRWARIPYPVIDDCYCSC